jgi:hypothetical protein
MVNVFDEFDHTARVNGWTFLGQPVVGVRRYGKRIDNWECTVRLRADRYQHHLIGISRQRIAWTGYPETDRMNQRDPGKRVVALSWLRGEA